jgi:hypothetical protein
VNFSKTVFLPILLLILGGCATISGSKMQSVSVQTILNNSEVMGVGCTLSNDSGSWFVTTPSSVTIHKSTADLMVDCKVPDSSIGHETVISKATTSAWGNIVTGGIVGYAIDRNTGAGFDYPSVIIVAMHKSSDSLGITQFIPRVEATLESSTAPIKPSIASTQSQNVNEIHPQKGLKEKLKELKMLRSEGAITEEEYVAKKRQLLDNM